MQETSKTPRVDVYMLKNVIAFCAFCDDGHATIGLTNIANYSVQRFIHSFIAFWILDTTKYNTMHTFIIFVRNAMLDSQPVTNSMVLHSWCSEALHRTMLVWLLRHQSDIMRSVNFITKHGVESASNVLIPKNKNCFFGINSNF